MKKYIKSCFWIIILSVGTICGFLLVWLMKDPFELYYLNGYVLIILMILEVFIAIKLFKKYSLIKPRYWKKVTLGFLSFITMIIVQNITQIWTQNKTWEINLFELIIANIVISGFGLLLSMLFSIKKELS